MSNKASNSSLGGQLSEYLETRLDAYLEDLRQLCAIDCFTAYKHGVDEAGQWVKAWATRRGWSVQTDSSGQAGNNVIVTASGDDPRGLKVLLVAHLDTVYPVGIAKSKFRIRGDKLLAPGIADNKSGLLSGLYAMAALDDLGCLERFGELCLACGSDEETTMEVSGALLKRLTPDYDLGFVLEAARANGDIVSARKGVGDVKVEVHGRAAHAGVEPEKGANAIVSLAQMVAALHKLNGVYPDVTVNTGVIQGGAATNAVPDYAMAKVDIRYPTPESRKLIEGRIDQEIQAHALSGTTYQLTTDWMPPMARSDRTVHLVSQVRACAQELGFDVKDVVTGGGSYANLLAGWNLPVLDGLGPIGGDDHNSDAEYILQSSIVPRTALLGLLLHNLAQENRVTNLTKFTL